MIQCIFSSFQQAQNFFKDKNFLLQYCPNLYTYIHTHVGRLWITYIATTRTCHSVAKQGVKTNPLILTCNYYLQCFHVQMFPFTNVHTCKYHVTNHLIATRKANEWSACTCTLYIHIYCGIPDPSLHSLRNQMLSCQQHHQWNQYNIHVRCTYIHIVYLKVYI